jgi:hypothetical protein
MRPISGRAGTGQASVPQEAYLPARSTALAGYVAGRSPRIISMAQGQTAKENDQEQQDKIQDR